MKAVLISIQPKWCELIAAGYKTVEVRKTKPKLTPPFRCYIYQTKHKWLYDILIKLDRLKTAMVLADGLCKVIGEFVCDKIFDIYIDISKPEDLPGYPFPCTGLTDKEILHYLGNGKTGYGWHISDLVIYDEPKKLSEFYKPGTLSNGDFEYQLYDGSGDPGRRSYASYLFTRAIRKPPQSWCYVEEV